MKPEPSPLCKLGDTVLRLDRIDYVKVEREEDVDTELGCSVMVGMIGRQDRELIVDFETLDEQIRHSDNLIRAWKAWLMWKEEK